MKIRAFFMQGALFCCLIFLFSLAWQWSHSQRAGVLHDTPVGYTLPSRVLYPMSLRFKGLVSNFVFLQTIMTLGEEIGKQVPFGERHHNYLVSSIHTVTDLDPRFWDPYLFAVMTLTWDFEDFDTARMFLEKAMKHKDTDWRPPYFLGFNCFYFLGDTACGAHYMGLASDKKGSPSYLPMLATRLAADAGTYKPAIFLLRQSIAETRHPSLLQHMKKRLEALELLDYLEEQIKIYYGKYKKYPESWEGMVVKGLLETLPKDPYGGELIMRGGRVYTTSGLLDK
ncbi:hypothetical protein LZ24_00002 [Desulfobotulus alkaliphilus]|uniref:Uncharacterized protein n=1 Tax=Desulfobotulus alkaliphilus TaxID=622671 RepID=A0A562S754_9BACT|nr:hypothetical protein [Desulfobotulus alkaliphilus]TWI77202.1 hypothetical protein LZ24_00002 [Desulfobotulus alkaliphilus]